MARFAILGESCRNVAGADAAEKFLMMAAIAIERGTGKFLASLPDVASVAISNSVFSQKRETARSVLLQYILSVAPTCRGVTIGAFTAELISVNILVTIYTGGTDVRKCEIFVAISAENIKMGADQRKPGFIVIEIRRHLQGVPGFRRVTEVAFELYIAMRVFNRNIRHGGNSHSSNGNYDSCK